jgi:hypothetical protein
MRALFIGITAVALAVPLVAQQEKVVPASDKLTQISVPADWEVLELNDAAELQVGNPKSEAYLIVLNELKDDMYGWNLEKHSRVTLGNLVAGLAFPVITGPKTLKIGDSPAIQYEIRGAAENRNVVYLHTTVDGPKYFSQILAWTLPSRADAVKPQLLKAINTFREVE